MTTKSPPDDDDLVPFVSFPLAPVSTSLMFGKLKHSLHKEFIPPDENAAFEAPEGVVRPHVFLD
ncbi:hypothetical protein Q0O72_13905, partial [Staphylococcus aureus]|nr:hypothetical protein [Staphylococcus aureus]